MKNLKIISLTLLLSFFNLTACDFDPEVLPFGFARGSDITVILLDNNKEHNAIIVSTKSGSIIVDKVNEFVKIYSAQKAPTQAEKISKEDIKDLFPYIVAKSNIKILKYTLYFEEIDSLNSSSKEKLLEIISKINERVNAIITVIGHTDTLGSSKSNDILARKRAEYVIDAIKKNGAKFLHSEIESYGENNLAVKTPDNTLETLNRRVEILIR